MGHPPTNTWLGVAENHARFLVEGPRTLPADPGDAEAMITANLFAKQGALALHVPYDARGDVAVTGPDALVTAFTDWLETAYGFQGHRVGYPKASPRDLHAALLINADRWGISEILVDDAAPPPDLPEGAVS
jgi:hypothetical protein